MIRLAERANDHSGRQRQNLDVFHRAKVLSIKSSSLDHRLIPDRTP
ncbi:hypothetical protein D779_4067 [Imhoffiella purpurea]|uniref:Uncharacterized protein n=1 Tax=Imhoffiella purpurea TaxID=1249627 RepID=W9V868_9GAMM|nr:hypothetical protein D779_4067 [Imhoffiella purpurea]